MRARHLLATSQCQFALALAGAQASCQFSESRTREPTQLTPQSGATSTYICYSSNLLRNKSFKFICFCVVNQIVHKHESAVLHFGLINPNEYKKTLFFTLQHRK